MCCCVCVLADEFSCYVRETAEYWFAKSAKDGNIAPQRKLANGKSKTETVDYDTLIKSWPASPPKRASN